MDEGCDGEVGGYREEDVEGDGGGMGGLLGFLARGGGGLVGLFVGVGEGRGRKGRTHLEVAGEEDSLWWGSAVGTVGAGSWSWYGGT